MFLCIFLFILDDSKFFGHGYQYILLTLYKNNSICSSFFLYNLKYTKLSNGYDC